MDKQLQVVKADGSTEAYLHTKVLGTINSALSAAGQPDMTLAEHLAEVVTFHLYDQTDPPSINSSEIFWMIKAALVATGCEEAAAALTDHALGRRLQRSRTAVLELDVQDFSDLKALCQSNYQPAQMPWDKTRIVQDLTIRFGLPRQTARAIASMVEERVFSMGMTTVPLSLIKQLVLSEAVVALRAEQQLQIA